jgi:RNA polymerase sigma-32 factor
MTAPSTERSDPPRDTLSRYLQEIRKFPILRADEEVMLAKRWGDNGDTAAANKLVTSHLRLVAKIAMGYRGYGLPIEELVSEGNVGMMQALKRFDPSLGYRFSTYAMWWIRAAIQEYILHSWSLVKLGTTAAQKKLFFNLRKVKGQIEALEDGALSAEHVEKIAAYLKVPEHEVINMNQRLSTPDQSLNTPVWDEEEGELQDWLVDDRDDQEKMLSELQDISRQRKLLNEALRDLNARERNIFTERRLKENRTTLGCLSRLHHISRERVRQIEMRAFEKVQKTMRTAGLGHHATV